MDYVLPLLVSLLLTAQKVTQKKYSALGVSGPLFFSGMISAFAMAGFMIAATVTSAWSWDANIILPALGFGLSYAAATLFVVLAIRYGSLARTTLVTSYSLLVPALAGLWILEEPMTLTLAAGILTLILSLWLTNHRRPTTPSDRKGTAKWAVTVTLAFAGNGLCSVVQKLAPRYSGGEELNQTMYMIAALGLSAAILVTASFLTGETGRRETVRRAAPLALICGGCNAGVNLLVLYLNGRLPASVMFPAISAGQIILVCAYSLAVCRERFTKKQWAGFAVGLLSAILLNL